MSERRWTLKPNLGVWTKLLPSGEAWPEWHVEGPPVERRGSQYFPVEVMPVSEHQDRMQWLVDDLDAEVEANERLREAAAKVVQAHEAPAPLIAKPETPLLRALAALRALWTVSDEARGRRGHLDMDRRDAARMDGCDLAGVGLMLKAINGRGER